MISISKFATKAIVSLALVSASFGALADMQSDRKVLIQKLIQRNVFQKVEVPGSLPRVWVTPLFHSLNFDHKQAFVSVVYAYYKTNDPTSTLVLVYDSKNGKRIGQFDTGRLHMD